MDRFTLKLRDYYTLTKPEVNLLILMTTSAGYYLASHGNFRVAGLVNTLVGTVLVASGTATLNHCGCSQWVICPSRNINGAFVPSRVHPAKEENASVHAFGRFPWRYADSDRVGGSLRAH